MPKRRSKLWRLEYERRKHSFWGGIKRAEIEEREISHVIIMLEHNKDIGNMESNYVEISS